MAKSNKQSRWNKRYRSGKTGWDIGFISTPLKAYFDQLTDKTQKILIPGSGNAYEAEYLFQNGFENTYIVDISEYPLQNFLNRVPGFPENQVVNKDFFQLEGAFDLIIEQTFFCAQDPALREAYVEHMYDLLNPGGQLVGLLFTFPLTEDGPPFGGSEDEYVKLFSEKFTIAIMEPAYNSIPPRQGKEVFFKVTK